MMYVCVVENATNKIILYYVGTLTINTIANKKKIAATVAIINNNSANGYRHLS